MSYYIGHCWPTPNNTQVDRSLVLTKGKEAVAKLLIELQVRKSTADAKGSRGFYTNLTKPIQGWEGEIRDIVLRKKLVRFWYHPFISDINTILFLASQNIRPAEYSLRGWQSRLEGVSRTPESTLKCLIPKRPNLVIFIRTKFGGFYLFLGSILSAVPLLSALWIRPQKIAIFFLPLRGPPFWGSTCHVSVVYIV